MGSFVDGRRTGGLARAKGGSATEDASVGPAESQQKGEHVNLKRITVGVGVAVSVLTLGAAPAFAHDCFNPQKDNHAPEGGVNYTITSFDPTTGAPVFEQTGPGKGYGGFVAISPEATGAPETLYVHSLGKFSKDNGHEVVGGPGSQKTEHACDGKGIDYLDACFG
jgi:hypothetical protein